ncbi:hypothetical protein [Marinobacterium weihaiense]|uniref:DUF4124 domain-containing protein n=1 Tax=Marinobacterium weihaiense TaxID=2851016 RepID=A0ABS6MBE7_9GAMM|nr:hypothetical protein [Marinobacterium weihaiense]MBV0933565.1 hypothetical protein [Marinobacterium weihaiense]
MKGILMTVLVSGLGSVSAMAQVYTCEVNDRRIFQSTPCAVGDAPMELQITPAATGDGPRMNTGVGDYLQTLKARRQQDRDYRDRMADEASQRRQWREKIERAIQRRQVIVGMTEDQVRRAWGQPTEVNRSTSRSGATEQWVYREKDAAKADYVYLENGTVSGTN